MLPAYLSFVAKKTPFLETNIYKYSQESSKYELTKSSSFPFKQEAGESAELEKLVQSFISINTKGAPERLTKNLKGKLNKSKSKTLNNQILTLDYEFPTDIENEEIISFDLKDKIYKDKLLSVFTTFDSKDLIYLNICLDRFVFIRLFINAKDNKLIFHKTEVDLKSYFEENNVTSTFIDSTGIDKSFDNSFESFLNGLDFAASSDNSQPFFYKVLQKTFEKIIEDPKYLISSFAKYPTLRPSLIIGGSLSSLIGEADSVVISADLLKVEGFFSAYFDKDNAFYPYLTDIKKSKSTDNVLDGFINNFMQDNYWGTFLTVTDRSRRRNSTELLATINIKDGYSNKTVYGGVGKLLRFNFVESGSLDVKFVKGVGVKIFENRNFELENLRKNVIFDFRSFDTNTKISDVSLFKYYLQWSKSLSTD